jgi:hypothetical protein
MERIRDLAIIVVALLFCAGVGLWLYAVMSQPTHTIKMESAPIKTRDHVHSLRVNKTWNSVFMKMGWQVRCRHCGEPSKWHDRVYPALQASQEKFGMVPPGWKLDE